VKVEQQAEEAMLAAAEQLPWILKVQRDFCYCYFYWHIPSQFPLCFVINWYNIYPKIFAS
jgi:hypothetical protein